MLGEIDGAIARTGYLDGRVEEEQWSRIFDVSQGRLFASTGHSTGNKGTRQWSCMFV